MRKTLILLFTVSFCCLSLAYCQTKEDKAVSETNITDMSMSCGDLKSDEEWKKVLSPEEYKVLREKGTEMAFTGKYYDFYDDGVYLCAACGAELFSSDTKYHSGSGWPSFYQPMDSTIISEKLDKSHGMIRKEIVCSRCGSHLGHVFPDGPNPTGLRYCVNSLSLDFKKK